jgi:dienelactone hydrolase
VLAPDWQKANMIDRWADRHYPESGDDVEAGLNALLARGDVCKGSVGVVVISRGPQFALRLAAKRPQDIAAIVSYYGHFQNPNAPAPQQLYAVAPEVAKLLGVRGDFTAKITVAPCDVDAKCIAQPADDLRDPARRDRRDAAQLSTPAAGAEIYPPW